MKILVTNNTLGPIGGSETYAYTFIKELKRRGYYVEGVPAQMSRGAILQELIKLNVLVNQKPSNDEYDVVFGSHVTTMGKVKHLTCPIVQTCHGVYVGPEQPSPHADIHVSISEEVQTHLKNKGFESSIIFNGIDLDRFKPNNPINNELKTILSLSQSQPLNQILQKVCDKLGVKFIYRNKFANPIFNIEQEINRADLVITLGRGAFEAMACGRPVLVLDKRPYVNRPPIGDGMVTMDNINDLMKFNCSGRLRDEEYNEQTIIRELSKYNKTLGDDLRSFAEVHLDIKKQVDKYLNLI